MVWNISCFPYGECHHPSWRNPWFFRGVGLNHQPAHNWISTKYIQKLDIQKRCRKSVWAFLAWPFPRPCSWFLCSLAGNYPNSEHFCWLISPFWIIQWFSLVSLPSGKLSHNYGKIHHFSWENPLFLWSFSIALFDITRGYMVDYFMVDLPEPFFFLLFELPVLESQNALSKNMLSQ